MDIAQRWMSLPHEWQPLFERWAEDPKNRLALHSWPQYGGQKVVGLTWGRSDAPVRLMAAVPHAHEPAGTAVMVNLASQLIAGRHLDGEPTELPIEEIRVKCLITLLPDTNSQGRAKRSERCWDGAHDDDTFLKIVFGIAADGSRFGRYPEWSLKEHRPRQIGIEYEQLTDDLFVEPNTSRRSTHFKAITELHARYGHTHFLDMHQHEQPPAAILPADFDELSPEDQAKIMAWAKAIIQALSAVGADPRPEPVISYRGQERQRFFQDFWRGTCPGMLRLVSEVRNNLDRKTGVPTTMEQQFTMANAVLLGTIKHLMETAT